MRKLLRGLAAVCVVVGASTLPASASCQRYVNLSPCDYGGASYGYAGASYYEVLPQRGLLNSLRAHPAQYYYVEQGPTFSGPGMFAPYPTYQETAVSGWRGYQRGYSSGEFGYDGGPYGNATNHYSDAQPVYRGPAIYSYSQRPRAKAVYRYDSSRRSHVRAGYYSGSVYGPSKYRTYQPRSHGPAYRGEAQPYRSYGPQRGGYDRRGSIKQHPGPKVIYAPDHPYARKGQRADAPRGGRID